MAPPQWAYQVDNFDPAPDEELICSICRAVFCEPVQCPCHHVFCRQCISKWLQENYSCPVCRKRVATRLLQDVVPIVKNMIMKLTLHCHNFEHGCDDKLTLEGCETHMKNCKFEMVQCKNRPCKEKLFRKDILKHETNDCTHRYVKCKICKLRVSTVAPEEHDCVKELISVVEKKRSIIKKKNLKIKSLEEENRKLKQAERDHQNIYSDSSFSVDIFSTDSSSSDLSTVSTDYVINWGTNTSDLSLEFEGNLSEIEGEVINIEMERSNNDPSVIMVNSSLETSDIQNITSDCIELPRASNSNHNGTITDISHETSDVLEISHSVEEEDEEQPRRPNKRRHDLSTLLSTDSSDNDELVEWWRPRGATASGSKRAEPSSTNYTSSSTGQSSSSTCSSSVPTRTTSSKRKKYRSNSADGETARGGHSSLESLDFDDQPAFSSRGAFEKTLAMLERYNLESDPEWVPPPGMEDVESDLASEQSGNSNSDSSPSSDNEESEDYISVNIPATLVLKRNRIESSSSDEEDTENPNWQQ